MKTDKELNYRLYTQREEAFIRSNIKSEFSRYNDIKYGNVENVKNNISYIKEHFYDGKGTLSNDPLRNNIYHFIVSAGIIARVCIDAGMAHDESYTLSDIYIRKADSLKEPEKIIDLLCEMQLDYASRMRNLKKDSAISIHIRNAIDYIYEHLHEPLTMKKLADNAGLDSSYFSKLFFKETGTTTKEYIILAKLKTAENMLLYSEHNLSEISLALGFSSQSAFTTAFKKYNGITPGNFKRYHNYKNIFDKE